MSEMNRKPAARTGAAKAKTRPARRQDGDLKNSRPARMPNRRGPAPKPNGAARPAAPKPAARSQDLFLEARVPEKKKQKTAARAVGRGAVVFGVMNILLLAGIGALAAVIARQGVQHARFEAMRAVVDQQTYYDGTTVDGVDVSQMTLQDAQDYWRDRVEPRYQARTVTLENGATVTARDLGYTSDYETVLSNAFSAGRSGSLEERYRLAANRQTSPVSYSVNRTDFSDNIVRQYVKLVAQQIDRPVQNAAIESFDPESYQFTFTEARPGSQLDAEALTQRIEQAIVAGGGEVKLPVYAIQPDATTEEVAARYGMVSAAVTNASSSSKARLNNIKLAMSMINGTRVRPGETFSFNGTVGKRTTSRGFQKAPAYSSGEVTEQVGGGICQVSTTLFNAVVKADLEVVERHNHSLPVAYVDKGKDATVNWDSQDFRFRNTSDDDVYICCFLTDAKRVRFAIFGKLLPNGETITVEAQTTGTIPYDTEYQVSTMMSSGQSSVVQAGRVGYEAVAYKIRWDADGNEIGRELLCKSRYQARNQIIEYGL